MMKKRENLLAVMRPLARPACKMVGNLLVGVIGIAAPSVVRKKCVVSLLTEANGGGSRVEAETRELHAANDDQEYSNTLHST